MRVFTSLITTTSISQLGSAAFNLAQPCGEGKPNGGRLSGFLFPTSDNNKVRLNSFVLLANFEPVGRRLFVFIFCVGFCLSNQTQGNPLASYLEIVKSMDLTKDQSAQLRYSLNIKFAQLVDVSHNQSLTDEQKNQILKNSIEQIDHDFRTVLKPSQFEVYRVLRDILLSEKSKIDPEFELYVSYLNLNKRQKIQFFALLKPHVSQIQSIRSNSGLSPEAKNKQIRILKNSFYLAIKPLLTSTQFKNWRAVSLVWP